jgi:hypothetical protein
VTTPAPPQAQQQPQPSANLDAALTAALAAALATFATAEAITVLPAIAVLLKRMRIDDKAMTASLQVVMSMPPGAQGFFGAAGRNTARLNMVRRAQFAVTSARRITSDLISARSRGIPLTEALSNAITRERRYFGMHNQAIWNRQQAAATTDMAALTFGRLLGWHTVLDGHTSAECKAANGHNFYVDQMPLIGYPGAVHPHCRCEPGAPFPGGQMLRSAAGRRAA